VVELNRALTEWKKQSLQDDATKVLSDTWYTDPKLVAAREALVEATEAAQAHHDQAPYPPRALPERATGDESWKGSKARPDKEEQRELQPSKPAQPRSHKDFRGKAVEVVADVQMPEQQPPFAQNALPRTLAPSPDEVFEI
jgi:hypothetical protein